MMPLLRSAARHASRTDEAPALPGVGRRNGHLTDDVAAESGSEGPHFIHQHLELMGKDGLGSVDECRLRRRVDVDQHPVGTDGDGGPRQRWEGSTMIGRWLRRCTTGTAEMSSVLRV